MTLRAKARKVFVSAIALLGICAVATFFSFIYFRTGERLVSHTQEVRAVLGDMEATVSSAARAITGYLLSGDPRDADEYRTIQSHVLERMEDLQRLTADNPVQHKNCEELESLIRERLRNWDQQNAQKREGQAIDLSGIIARNVDLAQRSAAVANRIRTVEANLLTRRVEMAHIRYRAATALVIASFTFALLLLCFYHFLLSRELKRGREAEQSAQEAYLREVSFRQNDHRFRLFIQTVKDYAIFTLDPNGNISSWNEGAERLKGFTTSEIVGKHFSCFYSEVDQQAGKPEHNLDIAAREGHVEDEGWRMRKDGSRFWASVTITAIRDNTGKLIGFAKVTRDFTDRMLGQEALRKANADLISEMAERKAAELKLARSEKSLRDLSLHLLRSQDQERKRIGRDLHDSLGQYLAVLKMNLDSLGTVLESNHNSQAGAEQVALCVRLADDALKEVRTISYLLYPPLLEEMGLKSAIPWYLDGFSKRSNIETTFDADPDVGRMAPDVELAFFRILQESLTNVHRHSGSQTANVRLTKKDGQVVLEIRDRGRGMPDKLLHEAGGDWAGSLGVGLRGMNERVAQLGGNFEVESSANGTLIRASVPEDAFAGLTKTA
jgi:PAS domain S-box-containing protein